MCIIKNMTIYSDKLFTPKTILVVSDIHRTNRKGYDSGLRNLERLYTEVLSGIKSGKYPKLDTILIPGDIINDSSELDKKSFRKEIIDEIYSMTRFIPTYISLGDHDQMALDTKGHWIKGNSDVLREIIHYIPNTKLLEGNQRAQLEEVSIGAFSPEYEYYEVDKEEPSTFATMFRTKKRPKFSASTYNILMTHTPSAIMTLSDDKDKCIDPFANLVVSGHMHNGIIKLPKNIGLISPQMQLFPRYAHGTDTIGKTKFLINGPVNNIVESKLLNRLFQPNASIITLKPSEFDPLKDLISETGYQKTKK